LDVSGNAYQRLMQGEQVQLIFEKKGSYLTAPFVLVEKTRLYPNFNYFNETKQVPTDKERVLQEVYEIIGNLPGFVWACEPAEVLPKGEGYALSRKGRLGLESELGKETPAAASAASSIGRGIQHY
jgi:hypothetical protein